VLHISLPPLAITMPILLFLPGLSSAGVAQLVEHLICNQRVGGSIPSASSTSLRQGSEAEQSWQKKLTGWCLLTRVLFVFCVFLLSVARVEIYLGPELAERTRNSSGKECAIGVPPKFAGCGWASRMIFPGRVGEWLKPADCKSAAPCGLRRFESFPVHQMPSRD
jgi:hypothetical protein